MVVLKYLGLVILLCLCILPCHGFPTHPCFVNKKYQEKFVRSPHPWKCIARLTSAIFSREEEYEDDDEETGEYKASSVNVLGTALEPCCCDVRGTGIGTGFYRNGYCSTGDQDLGRHTVCIEATENFLIFSASVGNDLSTPMPEFNFPGLEKGDRWCLCAARWVQAYQAGQAPKLFLSATHEKSLSYVPLAILQEFALDKEQADATLKALNEQREKLNKLL